MNPADKEAVKLVPTQGQPPSTVVGSHDNLEEQLHASLKDLQRTNHQSKPAKDFGSRSQLDEQLRVSVEALLHPSPPSIPEEEVDGLLLTITHHLDEEASERKKIHNRLLAIQGEMESLASRGLTKYLAVLCIGLAVIVAWLSYGEATKQIIATKAPELGWSPEAKQRIASWIWQLGWTKPLGVESKAAPVAQTAPATPSIDPVQVQQMIKSLAALRESVQQLAAGQKSLTALAQTVDQLTASQDQTARRIEQLQNADKEILEKISAPPPLPPKRPAPARKPIPPPSSSRASIPPRLPPHT